MGVKTEKKDQATLIAELISRVTSLEEDMEFVLEHISTSPTHSNTSNVLKSLEEKIEVKRPSDRLKECMNDLKERLSNL